MRGLVECWTRRAKRVAKRNVIRCRQLSTAPLRHVERGVRARTNRVRKASQSRENVVDLSQYLPILIYLIVALGLSSAFVFLPMGVARLTGAHNPNAEKLSEYECGFPAFEDPRSQFD